MPPNCPIIARRQGSESLGVRTRSIGVAESRTRDQDVLLSRRMQPTDKSLAGTAPLADVLLVLLHISRTDEVAKPNFVPGRSPPQRI